MNAARLAEVTVVPDFSAGLRDVFEARTLFFLASWLERFGEGNTLEGHPRPHLCCVGEPPNSVRRLAERARARISVHEPVAGFWGGFANKLRGLEDLVPGARRLLLDVDVLILGGLEIFRGITTDFAAAVAGKPQVPHPVWEHIYTSLGLPLPRERIRSLRGELGLGMRDVSYSYEGQQEEAAAMLPYYNSGVLLVRGGCGLRERWEAHMHRILQLASGAPEMESLHAVMFGDQVGLATALQSLQAQQRRTFAVLPDACNVRLVHLRAGALRWRGIALFHATGFLRELTSRAELPQAWESEAARWEAAIREGGHEEDHAEPRRFLGGLWERWVRPAWA